MRRPSRVSFDRLESRQLLAVGPGQLAAEARPVVPRLNESNIVYTTDASGPERLDVHLPGGQAPAGGWPVVLAIHGGGWKGGDKLGYEEKVDSTLLADGFAVVAPNYTLSKPGRPSWPANLDELRQAVVWVKREAASFDFDPSKVAAMGESAGGHLALMLGTDPGPATSRFTDQVDAVVDFFGPTDLATLEQDSPPAGPAVTRLIGGTDAQYPGRYVDASPVTHVSSSSPPVLIVQGAIDPLVVPSQSAELSEVLTSKGVPNEFALVPGAAHGFGLVVNGIDLRPAIDEFLDQAFGA